MSSPCIEFTAVYKKYSRQSVLNGVDLSLLKGESLGLVGINGAGKTTLIKCLIDLASVTSGDIRIFGQPNTETSARKNLAFLPERFTPPYYLTGRNFIEYMLSLYGIACDEDKVRKVLEELDFSPEFLGKPVRQLSKGMSQKLGLAACFLSDKPLYILDEPMSGLDPRARACLKKYLMKLKDAGKTMFFSSHLLNDVEKLCDRVAILHQGIICFTGSPEECCRQYASADFESAYLKCVEEVNS